MKVLSVLKTENNINDIPNKYIRMIGGFRQIQYPLYPVRFSSYKIDLLVLTDNNDVVKVCNLYNIKTECIDYKYDISDYDLVVYLKSTSMGVEIETLDHAIEYCITNKIKYLHANKDAFVIYNKNGIIDCDTYEISEIEQIDINDYRHLYYCKDNNYRVGFYVNGNTTRGLGHIFRVLDIADDFNNKPDIYYDINQTDISFFRNSFHNLIGVDGVEELYKKCKENKYDIFISDILQTSDEYMTKLRHRMPNCKLVNFEDDGPGSKKADLVFNALFDSSYISNIYGGEKYYICDESFLGIDSIKINDVVKNVFVCFGGADPANYTEKLLEIIANDKYKNNQFTIIIGKAKKNPENILKYNSYSHINIYYDVESMYTYMMKSDIALTSRGNVAYELAILGIPSISIAQNENEEKHDFACERNGFLYLGREPSKALMEESLDKYLNMSKSEREKLNKTLLDLDLKSGRRRIMKLICS